MSNLAWDIGALFWVSRFTALFYHHSNAVARGFSWAHSLSSVSLVWGGFANSNHLPCQKRKPCLSDCTRMSRACGEAGTKLYHGGSRKAICPWSHCNWWWSSKVVCVSRNRFARICHIWWVDQRLDGRGRLCWRRGNTTSHWHFVLHAEFGSSLAERETIQWLCLYVRMLWRRMAGSRLDLRAHPLFHSERKAIWTSKTLRIFENQHKLYLYIYIFLYIYIYIWEREKSCFSLCNSLCFYKNTLFHKKTIFVFYKRYLIN